ncbi:MAG: UvrB/UvrC motif-containing protein [Planctomycetota bacterium]|nr:UvrB/UvrC motif-containing protein [Planctomycetota bacterium]
MQCEICQENPSSVYVTDLVYDPETPHGALGTPNLQQICTSCAGELKLPHADLPGQDKAVLFKLLQKTAKKSQRTAGPTCKTCGMGLTEFRAQGRLGCADCYAVFGPHLAPLLLRMHQATEHTGRGPGVDQAELDRSQQLERLRERMDLAIREEDYENAARLRDELNQLEAQAGESSRGAADA